MAGERQDTHDSPPAPEVPVPEETLKTQAFEGGPQDDESMVRAHVRAAWRLVREGAPVKGFGELVRASRSIPMSKALASAVASIALKAHTEPAAVALLTSGVSDVEGDLRAHVRRQLVRLLRRSGSLERAREELVVLLAEKAGDRRARRVLNALLQMEERWEELDASLEREARDAVKRGNLRAAARATLDRARLWGERLRHMGQAAARYVQAAQLFEQARDFEGAFNMRLLWVRALRDARSPSQAIADAVRSTVDAGERVGKGQRARIFLRDMGLQVATPESPIGDARPAPAAAPTPASGSPSAELLAAAQEAEARGNQPEAGALLAAAVSERPDEEAVRRLEHHYVARGAWRDLALFYRDRIARETRQPVKIELLGKLAEVLEDELGDPAGAARTWSEIVRLTGDKHALEEQVRILRALDQISGANRALDEAVQTAGDDRARAAALVARGEAELARDDAKSARGDFEAALVASSDDLAARAGLAEAAAALGDVAPIHALRQALGAMPRRHPARADLFRRLARLAEAHLPDLQVARDCWSEVVADLPVDPEATAHLTALARKLDDPEKLELLLRAQLDRVPRGEESRVARMELVQLLESAGRADDALQELMAAVRFEPGHREAWLELVDRLSARGEHPRAAWALEHAATATEDEWQRAEVWDRLAEYWRDHLGDPAKSAAYALRARNLRAALTLESAKPAALRPVDPSSRRTDEMPIVTPADFETPPAGVPAAAAKPPADAAATQEIPIVVPPDARRDTREPPAPAPKDFSGSITPVETPAVSEGQGFTAAGELLRDAPVRPAAPPEPSKEAFAPPDLDLERPAGAVAREPLQPPVKAGPPTYEFVTPVGPEPRASDEMPPSPDDGDEVSRLFSHVRSHPLDPDAYHRLAEYFDDHDDVDRGDLMAEIATALEGVPEAPLRVPRLILSARDRAGLRHPWLRGEAGELMSLAGAAICELFPARGRAAGSREPFSLEAGPGAPYAGEALLSAVRILGLRAPDPFLAEDSGPPFSLVYARGPKLLVGRGAIRSPLPGPELRFFSGRALFTQNPELLVLRSVTVEQLAAGFKALGAALHGGRSIDDAAWTVRDALSDKVIPRLRQLYPRVKDSLNLDVLVEGARHSANRAGLIVAGGISPALSALRAKKALDSEVVELVRFAASERYLNLRRRHVA